MPGDSLLPDPPDLLGNHAPVMPEMRSLGDTKKTRKFIDEDVHKAASSFKPISDDKHTLKLTNVRYIDPDTFTKAQHKAAILTGETLGRRLKGTWELHDNATGQMLEKRDQVVAHVPHITELGTFVHNGNDYSIKHQQRLKPGVYARIKHSGEIESHANIAPGYGPSHRYMLDPAKGIFKVKFGQAEMPLMPVLQAMGATDKELRDAWGNDLHAANMKVNDASVIKKLKAKLLRRADLTGDEGAETQSLVGAFARMKMDPWVNNRTLGKPHESMTKDAVIDTTKKLLAVSRGEAGVDDRDAPAYQTYIGPEDLMRERIEKDHSRIQHAAFRKVSFNRSLAKMPSGLFTPQIHQALLGSGLAAPIEEINTAETFDKQFGITRLGEGGIPSIESTPDEARSVQPGHYGFMDPLRTPESFRAGIDLSMARHVQKGRDGQIYTQFKNPRTGKLEWKSPQDVADATIAFPDWADWKTKRVPVLKGGQLTYAKKRDVDYSLAHMEDAFSPLANLIPMKSAVKGQRVAMGSRMLTQALPLVNPESPHVRGAVPGSNTQRSFEEEYGKHMGAIHAEKSGTVQSVDDHSIHVKHDDGTEASIELYHNHPFARKTFLHQTPVVPPGYQFKPGELLAKSNYTDDKGAAALGLNARVAYIPWHGSNFEDANVISESMAKRFTSTHMYQHDLEITDKHKLGKGHYVSFFPHKFNRDILDRMDEKGVIRPGQTVNYDEPLVLAAREKELSQNKVHKKGQAGYSDESILWKHHDPGVVTDVVWGKSGPSVVVKANSQMQIGDKMAGRVGDKGVVSSILPDDQMPHDKNGIPYEVLLNPLGIISRTNPNQKMELWLGKIAAKTGKPINVEDFSGEGKNDMMEWTHTQLKKHNIPDTEDIIDPTTGRKIKNVATGNRFFMKLHHTAESKGQGRGSGGYSCFDAMTEALTHRGWVPWPDVLDDDRFATVVSGRLTYQIASKITREWYNGEMFGFVGRFIDYLVTSNHRMYAQRAKKTRDFEMIDAALLYDSRFYVHQFGFKPDRGHNRTSIELEAPPCGPGSGPRAGAVTLPINDYAELIGWYASEGGLSYRPDKREYKVTISQDEDANPANLQRIADLCSRLPFSWCFKRAYGKIKGVTIGSKTLAWHLIQYGTESRTKRLPRFLLDASQNVRQRLLEPLQLGDGHVVCGTTKGHPYAHNSYTTLSSGLADDVQELAIRLGKTAIPRRYSRKNSSNGYPAPEEEWVVNIGDKRSTALVSNHKTVSKHYRTHYRGFVYCATVPSGLLYVRRNGKPILTGNSDETPAKGGESGCFTGDTKIKILHKDTLREIPIEIVTKYKLGSLTFAASSRGDFQPITDWFTYDVPAMELLTVTLENGETFSVTRNHVLYRADGTEVTVGDLRVGDDLLE